MSDLREFDGDLVEALGPDFEVGMPVSCAAHLREHPDRRGVNAKALSVIMGHSTIAMTFDTYAT